MELKTPLSKLGRVGKITAGKFKRLGLITAEDLLYYYPFRYEDFRGIVPIHDLQEGTTVTVKGKLELIASRRSFKSRKIITEALVSDDTGSLRVVWFNQPFITKLIKSGDTISLSGTVKKDMLGAQLVSPLYEKDSDDTTNIARLLPVYPSTNGLTQKQIRSTVKEIIALVKGASDWLPEKITEEYDLLPLSSAVEGIHFPDSPEHLALATQRLKFDELFLVQLVAEQARSERTAVAAPLLAFHEAKIKDFVSKLPFVLTKTQKISAWEILQNINSLKPMNRLLSGDVGSGKTVVAALALYNTVLNGYQGVLMAPTEILATQHFESLMKLLPDLNIALYTGSQRNILSARCTKKEMRDSIAQGDVQIIIGTQALLSEGVDFPKLGLVIVDEQHRFGVNQRKIIKEKGHGAHFLSMTATPIPRSLALMVYGDLDVSIINELPPGRKKIITRLVEPLKRQKAYEFIESQIKAGRQAFVICPLIEQNIDSQVEKKSVMAEYEKLSKEIFAHLSVGYLHGKMKGEEKENIMAKFKNKEIDILVSTSVVEVGVDVPNASVMMIEGSDRFGLAQLHQFRGRVGRSLHQSYCLLFTDSDALLTMERLRYFEGHSDGFALAEKDLELRGPGTVYGTEQSGLQQLRLATLVDRDLIKKARDAAKSIVPEISKYIQLQKKLVEARQSVHLE